MIPPSQANQPFRNRCSGIDIQWFNGRAWFKSWGMEARFNAGQWRQGAVEVRFNGGQTPANLVSQASQC